MESGGYLTMSKTSSHAQGGYFPLTTAGRKVRPRRSETSLTPSALPASTSSSTSPNSSQPLLSLAFGTRRYVPAGTRRLRTADAAVSNYAYAGQTASASTRTAIRTVENDDVQPDLSPILPPQSNWNLPPIESDPLEITFNRGRFTSNESTPSEHVRTPVESIDFSRPRDDVESFIPRVIMTEKGEADRLNGSNASYHTKRPSTSDTVSILSSASSARSNRSVPPSIPDRTTSRKRGPILPSRGSSLKLAVFLDSDSTIPPVPTRSTPLSESRRSSTISTHSVQSALDPFPAVTSPSVLNADFTSATTAIRRVKQIRTTSFSSSHSPIPASPIATYPLCAEAIQVSVQLYRSHSAPNLRNYNTIDSAMPSLWSPHRFAPTARTPEGDSGVIDFSASPSATTSAASPRPRRLPKFDIDLFNPSPRPSPFAIEHIVEPRLGGAPRNDQTTFIPVYDTPLSPHARVTIRPAPSGQSRTNASTGSFSPAQVEARRADKMRQMIARAGINEASEAIKEAERWVWARPPLRSDRVLQIVVCGEVGNEEMEEVQEQEVLKGSSADQNADEFGSKPLRSRARHYTSDSYSSTLSHSSGISKSSSGSDMGLSESHSAGTMEDDGLMTPSSSIMSMSASFLTASLPVIDESITPTPLSVSTMSKATLPAAPVTPTFNGKSTSTYVGGSILRASQSTQSTQSGKSLDTVASSSTNPLDNPRVRQYLDSYAPGIVGLEPMPMPTTRRVLIAKPSQADLKRKESKEKEAEKAGWKGSLGRSRRGSSGALVAAAASAAGSATKSPKEPKKKAVNGWTFFPDVGSMGSMM